MNEPKFTPGPWKVEECYFVDLRGTGQDRFVGFNIIAPSGDVVGDEGIVGDSDQTRADANLIAAAPDLLEALKTLARDVPQYALSADVPDRAICADGRTVGEWRSALAAIKKAEGAR